MIRRLLVFGLLGVVLILLSFVQDQDIPDIALWRKLYSSGDSKRWPKPHLDDDVKANFVDIGTLPNVQYPADNRLARKSRRWGKYCFSPPGFRLQNSWPVRAATIRNWAGAMERV